MEPVKPWYFSKTIWVNVVAAIALIFAQVNPSVAAFLGEHFKEAGMGWALLNIVLRAVTKKELT